MKTSIGSPECSFQQSGGSVTGLFANVLVTRGWDSALMQCSFGSDQGWDGIKRFLRVCPVFNQGLYIEEYACITTCFLILQFPHDRF